MMLIERILKWLGRQRFEIGRGDDGKYLTRWMLLGKRDGASRYRLMLHHFQRSDLDTFHDHPWWFVSLILWGGYWEETPAGRKWYRPGRLLFRPAEWRHRVEIRGECWTLILTGPKVREWGFWCPSGWRHWTKAVRSQEASGNACAE